MDNLIKFYFIVLIVLLLFSFLYGKSRFRVCYDSLKINKEKLMRDCKVTPEEYWHEIEKNPDFCPEGRESVKMIGGCNLIAWNELVIFILVILIIYNIFYFLFYLLIKRLKRKKSEKFLFFC